MTLKSSLSRFQPRQPTSLEEIQDLRRAAWHQQGIAVLDPDQIHDAWSRQAVVNEANRLFGRRREATR
jgi:hypothetical protein